MRRFVLREVGNENPYKLPAKEPLNLQVDGVITCIYAFLEKRWGTEQIDKEHTHILVNRENLVVTLVTNENDGSALHRQSSVDSAVSSVFGIPHQ